MIGAIAALAVLAGMTAGALAGTGSGSGSGHDEPAPSPTPTDVPSRVQTPESAEAAARAAADAGQGVAEGSVRLRVPAARATGGYALWTYRTEDGQRAHMIVDPSGRAASWGGCRPRERVDFEVCGGSGTLDGVYVATGLSGPEVSRIEVAYGDGTTEPGVVGEGGWLFHATGLPIDPVVDPEEVPAFVTAYDATGGRVGTASLRG